VGGIYAIANRDKAHQGTPIGQYPPASQGMPYLVDAGQNGVISSQYVPRFQNAPVGVPAPPSVYVGNSDDRSVLTPSTVRENVPIVRKQAATFHNYTTVLPPTALPPRPVVFEPVRTAPVFNFPQQGYTSEAVNTRVGSNTN
jgi:hypothetical protein